MRHYNNLRSEQKFDAQLETIRIGRSICFGGSPPPGPPTSSTSNTSNLPAYLEPYVKRNVAAAEAAAARPSWACFLRSCRILSSSTILAMFPAMSCASPAGVSGKVGKRRKARRGAAWEGEGG